MENTMNLSAGLLPEFDHEMALVRKTLERIPDGKLGWKPHEKSMSFGHLAGHLAELPSWLVETIHKDSLDFAPVDGPSYTPPVIATTADALAMLDKYVKTGREALVTATDATLLGNWSLLMAGQIIFTMPRIAVLRTWVLNHAIHHRGQMSVYLRMNDIPVPSIYGPSADEGNL